MTGKTMITRLCVGGPLHGRHVTFEKGRDPIFPTHYPRHGDGETTVYTLERALLGALLGAPLEVLVADELTDTWTRERWLLDAIRGLVMPEAGGAIVGEGQEP